MSDFVPEIVVMSIVVLYLTYNVIRMIQTGSFWAWGLWTIKLDTNPFMYFATIVIQVVIGASMLRHIVDIASR